MIDVRQLRIGAHVLVNGKQVEIESITNDSLVGYYTPDNDWEAVEPYRLEPIAITPELLTELGFEGWFEEFVGKDKRYGKRIKDKEIIFSQIDDGCWEVGLLFGGFDVGYCLCCCLHQAEAFLALHNVELLTD